MQDTEQDTKETTISDILKLSSFQNPAIGNAIVVEASAQESRHSHEEGEKHAESTCSCCSDSRQTKPTDSGYVRYLRSPGAFQLTPEGELTTEVEVAIEITHREHELEMAQLRKMAQPNDAKVVEELSVYEIKGHSLCGAQKSIYINATEGEAAVRKKVDPEFISLVRSRRNLYGTVSSKGVDQYKKFGINLELNDKFGPEAQFQACQEIEKILTESRAVAEKCAKLGGKVRTLTTFDHLAVGGQIYILDGDPCGPEDQIKFIPIPLAPSRSLKLNSAELAEANAKYGEEIEALLKKFPGKKVQARIIEEITAQNTWQERNDELKDTVGKDMSSGQNPEELCFYPSNPSADATGEYAKLENEALFLRTISGVIVTPEGELTPDARVSLGLGRANGCKAVQYVQLSDRRLMGQIYDFHSDENVELSFKETLGEGHYKLAHSLGWLYTKVEKRLGGNKQSPDFSHYENIMGIKLEGDTRTKFANCMCLELGITSYEALLKAHSEPENYVMKKAKNFLGEEIEVKTHLPEPVFFHQIQPTVHSGNEGYSTVYDGESGKLIRLPKMDERGDPIPTRHDPKKAAAEVTKVLG